MTPTWGQRAKKADDKGPTWDCRRGNRPGIWYLTLCTWCSKASKSWSMDRPATRANNVKAREEALMSLEPCPVLASSLGVTVGSAQGLALYPAIRNPN